MNNTTVQITFPDGSTQFLIATDMLDDHIASGGELTVTVAHNTNDSSRMYGGDPAQALHWMRVMHNNVCILSDDEHPEVVRGVLSQCIQLLVEQMQIVQEGALHTIPEAADDTPANLFIPVIEYASRCDSPQEFLKSWMEGDLTALAEDWPDFVIPSAMLLEQPMVNPVDESEDEHHGG